MNRLIQYFIERKLLVYLLSLLIIAAGFMAALGMRRQVLPDVDMLMVQITTIYPAASARDVELNVTVPLEEKLLEVDGIKKLRSVSMENFSQIIINLDPDMQDVDKVKANIRRAVDQVTDLPKEITQRPAIAEWDTSWVPIAILGLHGDSLTEKQLRQIANRLEKEIEALPGVARVDKLSFRDPEIRVAVSREKLNRYYLTLQDVALAIRNRNIRLTGGTMESFSDETSVLTLAEFNQPEDISNVIIRSNFEGNKIVVRDVARVEDGLAERHFEHRINGLSGLALRIHKKKSADSVHVMEAVEKHLAKIKPSLPPSLVIQKVRDSSVPTVRRLHILQNNAIIGFVLLMAILIMFLNLRIAFWTAMGIPIALSVGALAHVATGGSNDSISIMVFIQVLGMLVDDAIVVAENIHRHREEGMTAPEAALKGVKEVAAPIMATVSTTIVAFLPLLALGGMLGLFIRMIPIIIAGTLLGSVIESFFFLPSHLAQEKPRQSPSRALADPLFNHLRRLYARGLGWALRHKGTVLLCAGLLLMAGGYLGIHHLKFVLFPVDAAEDTFAIIETPVGSSYQSTLQSVIAVEKIIRQLPHQEWESFETFVGSAEAPDGSEMTADNLAMIYLKLTPYQEKRQRTAAQILDELRTRAEALPGIASVQFNVDGGGPPVGRPVELNIIGDNEKAQRLILDQVMAYLDRLPGVLDPTSDLKHARDEEVVTLNHDKLAAVGLTAADIAATIRMAYQGDIISSIRFVQEEVDIRLHLQAQDRRSPQALFSLMVRNHDGKLIPLRQLITLTRRPALQGIRHYTGQRVVTVTADVDNKITTSQEINQKIMDHFQNIAQQFPGMRLLAGGEAEESAALMKNMTRAAILAVLAIYFILILLLRSVLQPLIILLAIPFGLIGVMLAFWLQGMTIGFMALLGMLGMSGVVVNDSLIILSFIHQLVHERRENNRPSHETIIAAATTRLRPVILTTLTTAVALIPTAYGLGGKDFFVQPMVMAMLWGIVFATALTLLWVPTLYAVGQAIRQQVVTWGPGNAKTM